MSSRILQLALTATPLLAASAPAFAQTAQDSGAMQKLNALDAKVDALFDAMDAQNSSSAGSLERLTIGGYGEYHGNFIKDGGKYADPHRFVLYLGYDFGSGITMHSETELEHGFVNDGDGEISLEQLYAEIELNDNHSVLIGRLLNPLGIINQRHEPNTFNGVERPNVEKYIIPSTWSQDGVGLSGRLNDELTYQLQLTSSLDGSAFDATNGIRDGRVKENPSLSDPALSGRLDWAPQDVDGLRLGVSFYSGGATGGNKDADVGVDASVDILALDAEYSIGNLDLRGVLADSQVTGAEALNALFGNDVGSRQTGAYLEAAYHLLDRSDRDPDARFPESDLVAFVRVEEYDTQDELPTGAAADPTAHRKDITVGLGWWLTPKFVIKAELQDLDFADSNIARADQVNLGIGWML